MCRVTLRQSLLAITDIYSRFTEVKKIINAAAVINQFEQIFSIFGYPESIKSFNGLPFNKSEFRNNLKWVSSQDSSITPEHPQSNAVVKSFYCLLNKLDRIANFNQKYWENERCMFFHSYRNALHVVTGKTPSMLYFNTPTKTYLPSCIGDTPQSVNDTIRKNQSEKHKCIKKIQKKNKMLYN